MNKWNLKLKYINNTLPFEIATSKMKYTHIYIICAWSIWEKLQNFDKQNQRNKQMKR